MFSTHMAYKFSAIVNTEDGCYLVDSCDTFDRGYELMVFKLSKSFPNAISKAYNCPYFGYVSPVITKEVHDCTDFNDLYVSRYDSIEEAEDEFDICCHPYNLELVLDGVF